jgi:hypothetical protein
MHKYLANNLHILRVIKIQTNLFNFLNFSLNAAFNIRLLITQSSNPTFKLLLAILRTFLFLNKEFVLEKGLQATSSTSHVLLMPRLGNEK